MYTNSDKVHPKLDDHPVIDSFSLGKFDDSKTRSVLLKLVRSIDGSNILANCKNLASISGISSKPQMTTEEKQMKLILLNERRSLIVLAGIPSKHQIVQKSDLHQ